MRVLHIISSLTRSGGGPSRSVQGLVSALNRAGFETSLMALKKGDKPWVEGVGHCFEEKSMDNVLAETKPNIVHIHGIWAPELHACVCICRKRGIPYVIAPRGMLEPWSLKHKWLKKRIARFLYQDADLKHASALHATAESEAAQFQKLGFANTVIISPNGVNLPSSFSRLDHTGKRILFVSRMHPKKGVLELVEAFSKCSACSTRLNNWIVELVYTTNSEFEREYEARVRARVDQLGLSDQFVFTGSLNDEEKWAAYGRADLFVLPTYSENFGIVVAEALWAGVPVITTKGTPWQELEERKCGWWIDIGVEPLVDALKEAMSLSTIQCPVMGLRGRKLVEEKYTWDAVVKAMIKGYEDILK